MEQTFSVPDVSCGHCKSTIEGALDIGGVERAEVDIERRAVTVSYDPEAVSQEDLIRTIEGSGYPVAAT